MIAIMWGNGVRVLAVVWAGFVSLAAAQGHGGVASSGMGQGEAEVSTRSDVRMSIESGPGTGGARLTAMVRAVSAKLGDLRECYADVIAQRPQIAGTLRLRAALRRGRGRRLEATTVRDTAQDPALERCVHRALRAVSVRGVEPPAVVFVELALENTAAAGASEVARRRALEDRVEVTRDSEGRPRAAGGEASGLVRFVVTGQTDTSEAALSAVQRTVRATIPSLLDCRRRAGRRGMSPEGEVVVSVTINARGRARAREVSSTLADTRAPQCIRRALGQASFTAEAASLVQLQFLFAGRRDLGVPTRP